MMGAKGNTDPKGNLNINETEKLSKYLKSILKSIHLNVLEVICSHSTNVLSWTNVLFTR